MIRTHHNHWSRVSLASAGLLAAAALLLFAPSAARAEGGFAGTVAADKTTVYAGGTFTSYPVGALDKGAGVQVDSILFEWYKVVPPAGIYSYVSKGFVDAKGDGKSGTVNHDAEVKAAGAKGPAEDSYRTQMKLTKGEAVQIVGEDGSFYKIVPPKGAFVFLPPGSVINPAAPAGVTPAPARTVEVISAGGYTGGTTITGGAVTAVAPPTTRPATGNGGGGVTTITTGVIGTGATTRPSDAAIILNPPSDTPTFAAAEAQLRAAVKLPLEQQPLADLTRTYAGLAADATLMPGEKTIVAQRQALLKRNTELAASLKDLADLRADINKPLPPAAPPTTRPAGDQPRYSAVGQLLGSSVYDGVKLPRLYRLIEPATYRTVAYVQPASIDPAVYLGRMVGIIAESQDDANLKLPVLTVKQIDLIEPPAPTLAPGSTAAVPVP